jgi:bifunctional DNase/RNase
MHATLALAAALVAGPAALAAAPARLAPPELVEMEIAGVFPLDDAQAGVLVLRQKGAATLLPIVVGRVEASVIQNRLRGEEPVRPRAQELLERAISALGGRVVQVEIRDASEALYRARVLLAQGSARYELDARPSDSVALAIGARAPIFATRSLVEESGLTREDLERMRRAPTADPERATENAHDERM